MIALPLQFLVAMAVTALAIRPLARFAPALGLCDRPGPRKVHSRPVPRVGGIAMAIGIVAAMAFAQGLDRAMVGALAGAATLLVFGIWDDRNDLKPALKFIGQFIAVGLAMYLGDIRIDSVTLEMRHPLPDLAGQVITFAFLVGITNAVNLSDGLDGLAGGMVLLCLAGVALLAAANGQVAVVGMALVVCGAILGFLRFNTHPAQVFMGDAGSQLLGFTTGTLAILATQGDSTPVSAALPLLLLGVPILDTIAVIVQRLRAGRSPFSPDRNHLHHRLLALGCAHSTAVAVLYLLQAALFLLAYFMRYESDALIVATVAALALALIAVPPVEVAQAPASPRGSGWAQALDHWRSAPPRGVAGALVWPLLAGVGVYAAASIVRAPRVGLDLAWLCAAMLALLAVLAWRRAPAPLWMERIVAYIGVVALVYLDETTLDETTFGWTTLTWILIGVAMLAAIGRSLFDGAARFRLSTLDVLVLFAALVVPNLPGSISLSPALAGGIAKTVVLLYVVELQLQLLELDRGAQRAIVRVFLAIAFCAIATRGFVGVA